MKINQKKDKFPNYCDFGCKYAGFADKSSSGDCRRDIPVYCKHFKQYNSKNSKCIYFKK